jgi:hypothetical protein
MEGRYGYALPEDGKYTGYFSSVMELINIHVMSFVACPRAQVYWWL